MGRRLSAATVLLAVVAAASFALLLASVPAAAHHKDDHQHGGDNGAAASQADDDSKGKGSKANDGNTPNNVPDDGDNAHPSGKDKSVENGGSGTQGSSESDPDDDGRGPDRSNGGPDKPNGSGGVDKADQDGNNGCGNDDDFEDDNEGWCGGKPKPAKPEIEPAVQPAGPCDADAAMAGTQPCKDELDTGVLSAAPCVDEDAMADGAEACEPEEEILGGVISRPATPELDAALTSEEPHVLGERLGAGRGEPVEAAQQRGASFLGRPLPFTGSGLTSIAAVAVGLLLVGAGILTTRSSRT